MTSSIQPIRTFKSNLVAVVTIAVAVVALFLTVVTLTAEDAPAADPAPPTTPTTPTSTEQVPSDPPVRRTPRGSTPDEGACRFGPC
jgi:hypothetical protein